MNTITTRTCCVQCVDWPVVVTRFADASLCDVPVVVRERIGAQRDVVRAASAEARAEGVRTGMRRREAEACCGDAVVLDADPSAEATCVRVHRPGRRGVDPPPRARKTRPARLPHPRAVALLRWRRRARGRGARGRRGVGPMVQVRIGVADGRFAARLAARAANPVMVVEPGASAAFLAPYPVERSALPNSPRCWIGSAFPRSVPSPLPDARRCSPASVPAVHACMHWRAGDDPSPAHSTRRRPTSASRWSSSHPPARVDTAAFVAKALADQLVAGSRGRGLACTRVLIEAETEHGERLERSWWHEAWFTARGARRTDALAARGMARRNTIPSRGDAARHQDMIGPAEGGLALSGGTTGALARSALAPEVVVPIPASSARFLQR